MMYGVLVFLKCFHWITADRVDYVSLSFLFYSSPILVYHQSALYHVLFPHTVLEANL